MRNAALNALPPAPAPLRPAAGERLYPREQARVLPEMLLRRQRLAFRYPGAVGEVHGGCRLDREAEGCRLGPADEAGTATGTP